jgi:hypothetical protein
MKATFWEKWKVFFIGLAGSVGLALTEFLKTNSQTIDYKVLGFALLISVLSYVSTTWRGSNVTILGMLGSLVAVAVTMLQNGAFSWQQFILYAVVAILGMVASPPKPASYEKNPAIEKAKQPDA